MKVKSMRRLDRLVGVPLSALLTGGRRIGDGFRKPVSGKPERILIVKLVEQGATVVAEQALRRAVEIVGRENVFFAVFEENRAILDLLDIIPSENVIVLRSSRLTWVAIDTLRAIWRTRREKIDTAIDFEFFSRFSGAFAYLSGARRRVGFHSFAGEAGYRGDLMTHRIAYNIGQHASETYRMLVEASLMSADDLPAMNFTLDEIPSQPRQLASSSERRDVEETLRGLLGRDTIPPLILMNANSGDLLPLRRWSSERYVDLSRRLLNHYPDAVVAFTGSPDERQAAEELARQVGSERCLSVAGETTLRQLLILCEMAEVLVSNDSGPAHFASLTDVDVVTLFGPETPAVFGSRSPRSHIIWARLACSPCVNAFNQRVTNCSHNLCMQKISVDQVFAAVCQAFDQRKADVLPLPVQVEAMAG